jgi:shikimate kinase
VPDAESTDAMGSHIVIVGAMGSGKTTLARGLAGALGWEVFDSDLSITERSGRIGREIAESDGVDVLHRLEADVLLDALAKPGPAVVAAAASVIEVPEVREALEDAYCVWVTADPDILAERSARGSHRRDVARHEDLGHRDRLFEEAADLVVDTGELSEAESLRRVLDAIEASRR